MKISLSPEVVFNGSIINTIEIKRSAQKHFRKESAGIFLYIASTLNGQYRAPDEPSDNPKNEVYKIASCVIMDNIPKIAGYDYRDTCFNLDQKRGMIIFFHGSQRDEKDFEKIPQKQKERIE